MNKIVWSNEIDRLKSLLLEGKSYREIGEIYNRKPSSIREQVIKLDLYIYFQHKVDKSTKKSIDEIIEKKLRYYPNSIYLYTRKYLINKFKEDINYKGPKGILLKEDIINEYKKSRENSFMTFNYDFSRLPKYVNSGLEKFDVIVNEISPKTGKYVGLWTTNFKNLVINKQDNGVCGGIKSKVFSSFTTEDFIKISRSKFGNTYGYDKVKYINMFTPVLLRCNICGEYFLQVPSTHLESPGLGCPACSMKNVGERKALGIKILSERCDEIYGPIYDFTNSIYINNRTELVAINKLTGKEVIATPERFLNSNPESDYKSLGERCITNWLEENHINYLYNYSIQGEIMGRKKNYVRIDFILEDLNIWIEYNGLQHYRRVNYWVSEEEFKQQLQRDQNIRDYCKRSGIKLLEIPYTYDTNNKISELLTKIILNKENIIIDYPIIENYE